MYGLDDTLTERTFDHLHGELVCIHVTIAATFQVSTGQPEQPLS